MTNPRHQPVPQPPGNTPTPTPTPAPSGLSPTLTGTAWQTSTAWQTQPTATGRRRTPGWVIALAITTAVLSVAAFTTGLLWPTGDAPAEPLRFHAFEQVARINYDQPSANTFTRVIGNRMYVAWEQDGDLMVVAAALEDGSELWRRQVTGSPGWGELLALEGAVVAVGAEGGSASRMYVLDGGGGAVLWERDVSRDDWVTTVEDHLVWYDAANERLQGVEIATGRDSWTYRMPSDAVSLWVLLDEDLNRSSDTEGNLGIISTDHRLVVVDEEGTAYVVDGRNGTVLSQGANLARTRDYLLAYDGRLYVAADQAGFQLLSYSLDDLGGLPRTHYRAGPQRYPAALEACGPDRVCLLELDNFDRKTTEVVAVDVAEDRGALWRQPVPDGRGLLPVGDWVTVTGFDIPARAFDASGSEVLNRPGVVARLNAGNLLVFADELSNSTQDLSVAGVSVTGDPPTELGHLSQVVGAQCSWNEAYLTCPDRNGATIWRFAEEP